MIKIIWNAVLLGVIALAAAWLSNNPGSLHLEWIGYSVQTSVAVVIGTAITRPADITARFTKIMAEMRG